ETQLVRLVARAELHGVFHGFHGGISAPALQPCPTEDVVGLGKLTELVENVVQAFHGVRQTLDVLALLRRMVRSQGDSKLRPWIRWTELDRLAQFFESVL